MTPQGLNADQKLALSYVPQTRRAALAALWQLDAALGAVLAGGRDPMIRQIKLAWWRESLQRLDQADPPAEPLLKVLAGQVLPMGISGTELALMEEGWAWLLTPETLDDVELNAYAAGRGGRLFLLSARLLGGKSVDNLDRMGEAWALVDLARRSRHPDDIEVALAAARRRDAIEYVPSGLRPLSMLAVMARRDAQPDRPRWERHGGPGRMWCMLCHRLTGR